MVLPVKLNFLAALFAPITGGYGPTNVIFTRIVSAVETQLTI